MEKFKISEALKKLREEAGYSQEQLAGMLGLGRASLAHIEMGLRSVKADELKRLSDIFDVSVDFLLGNTDTEKVNNDYDIKKFEELLLYIVEKCGAKYNVGKTVLYKLLYFAEFDFFELYGQYISGISFIKLPRGPAPYSFEFIVKAMEERKEIIRVMAWCGSYLQERYMPNRRVEVEIFSDQERDVIDDVINRYSDYSATEISEKSHEDIPWKITKDMDIISYDLVGKREYPYSPHARKNKKKDTQQFAKITGFFDDLAHEPDAYEEYR